MQPDSTNVPENKGNSLIFKIKPTLFCAIGGILLLLFSINALAKSATVHITVKNYRGSIWVYGPELRYDLTKTNTVELKRSTDQSASYTVRTDKPTCLILLFESDRHFNFSLFLSPGDELFITADFAKKNNNIVVTGNGSNNNQPEIFALTNMDIQPFKEDTTPYRVISTLNRQFLLNKAMLAHYIKVHQPSASFIKTEMANLRYFVPMQYYVSSHNNVNGKPIEQQKKWQKIQDSLFSTVKLSNDAALSAYNYTQFIDHIMRIEQSALVDEFRTQPVLFYKQWFHCDTARGKQLFKSAQMGILTQKVVDKYFTGRAAEYAYRQALKREFQQADYPSTILLFDHFKKRYPASARAKGFAVPIAEVVNKQRQALNSKTFFVRANGTNLNTFNEVLALNKGKTVFIDMWGTWCGTCREEIKQHAAQLRAHFKGKNVVFLYIANLDAGREKEWKKQINYFQIEGEHILANPKLTEDIMGKVKSTGYPTYIIVKKDGNFKQTATRYPVNILAMIKEIEAARS